MTTRLDTLGGIRVYRHGEELTSLPRRPMQCALLVYLAVEREATRDTLMAVLWPEKDLDKARGSLNNTAYELRRALGEDWVVARGDTLRVRDDIETDVRALSSAVEEERFSDAVALADGAFLEGTHLAGTSEFESWVDGHRSRVEQLERVAHRGLVRQHVDRGDSAKAIASARAWVHRVPHDDEAHYWLIRLLAEGGHRADALKIYDRFRDALHEEYGVQPEEAVLELVERIRAGEISGFSPPSETELSHAESLSSVASDSPDGLTPDEVWHAHPGWGRKLIKSLGFYLVPAIGLLELLGTLIENAALPQELFRPAWMLVLLGIPVVAATTFFQSQPVDERPGRGIRPWIARWFTWRNTVLGGVAASAAFVTAVFVLRPQVPSWSQVPSHVAVLPFELPNSSDEERTLAVQLADAMTRELHIWESVSVPSDIALTAARLELGLTERTLNRTATGVGLAKELGAPAMIAVTATIHGDSASLEATLYDSGSGLRSPQSILSAAEREKPDALVAPVLAHVLGFASAPNAGDAFGAGTAMTEAAEAYLLGRRQLASNRLGDAEASFLRAIEIDSTFASAMTYLAQTIFWRDGEYTDRASDIARWSTSAMGHLEGLSDPNALHVRGFYAFQLGEYAEARKHYEQVLAADPGNVNALMMVGHIEWHDPWMIVDEDGTVVPRSDLNRAWRSYSEAVRVDPTYEPAYGRLIDLQTRVERAVEAGSCPAFETLRGEARPPYQAWVVTQGARAWCPAALDSIRWLTRSEFASMDRSRLLTGADRLFRETERMLNRWAALAPSRPQPREQHADLLLSRRSRFEVASPERLRATAREALEQASAALSLQADTSPSQLSRLANLHLASGDAEAAVEVARGMIDHLGADSLHLAPQSLINVLVAAGETKLARSVALGKDVVHLIRDPETEEFISYAGAEPTVDRIRILGALGVPGPPLHADLEELTHAWGGVGYSSRWQQLLRNHVTSHIAIGLVSDPQALARWADMSEADAPLWLGLRYAPTEPDRARAYLDLARQEESPGVGSATETYLLGVIAGRLGLHEEAIRRYARLDSIPHSVRVFDAGWGLQRLSLLLRAEHHERLGEDDRALQHYRRFVAAPFQPDALSRPTLERAIAGIGRLSP